MDSLKLIASCYSESSDDEDTSKEPLSFKKLCDDQCVIAIDDVEDIEEIPVQPKPPTEPPDTAPAVETIGKNDSVPQNIADTYRTTQAPLSDDETDSENDSSSSESTSSSNTSSSSSSSSSSSDSSAESDESEEQPKNKDKNSKNRKVHQERGEYDNLPPIEDLTISVPEVLCERMGQVGWIVEQIVVVVVPPELTIPALNLDTVLFLDRGQRVLGRIFDVFGPVADPHYCVRFNDAEHIKNSNVQRGMITYYCPNTPYTSVIFMKDLMSTKPAEDLDEGEHPEFSDDEAEKAYFAALNKGKQLQKTSNAAQGTTVGAKRAKATGNSHWQSKHPWHSGKRPQQRYKRQNHSPWTQQGSWQSPADNFNPWAANPAYNWQSQNSGGFQAQGNTFQSSGGSQFWPPTANNVSWIAQPPPPPPPDV